MAVAFYAFRPVVLDTCRAIEPSESGEYELPDAPVWLFERGHAAVATDFVHAQVNVTTPDDLATAERLLAG